MKKLTELLANNTYPGRGIVVGRTAEGTVRVFYFIMGRSLNSRNRVFIKTGDGIRTEAFDPSKMSDPSLIIYHPVRAFGDKLIVTNGDQTDTIRDYLQDGKSFRDALMTREFEPDGPNYTPRISAIVNGDGSFELSILKSAGGDPSCCCRYFYTYDKPLSGEGRFISTYSGDGEPLPSFEGEPVRIDMPDSDEVWAALNADNKVSLYALDLGGEAVIYNRHK